MARKNSEVVLNEALEAKEVVEGLGNKKQGIRLGDQVSITGDGDM